MGESEYFQHNLSKQLYHLNLLTHTCLYSLFHFFQHDCIWDIPSSWVAHRSPETPTRKWTGSQQEQQALTLSFYNPNKRGEVKVTVVTCACQAGQHSLTSDIVHTLHVFNREGEWIQRKSLPTKWTFYTD